MIGLRDRSDATALYHDVSNLCWQLFPNSGSHYDPRFTGLLSTLAAAGVTVLPGPRSLAQYRATRSARR